MTLCGCTEATAIDLTAQSAVTISFVPNSYTPDCIKVKAGTCLDKLLTADQYDKQIATQGH